MMRAFALIASLLLAATTPLRADDVSDAQTVINAQANAFSRDDGMSAYSHASPLVQQIFPEVETFMTMVRSGYAPLYRHRSFEFGKAGIVDGKISQLVNIIDDKGEAWDALYTLERQPDGSLKITGCTLLKAGGTV